MGWKHFFLGINDLEINRTVANPKSGSHLLLHSIVFSEFSTLCNLSLARHAYRNAQVRENLPILNVRGAVSGGMVCVVRLTITTTLVPSKSPVRTRIQAHSNQPNTKKGTLFFFFFARPIHSPGRTHTLLRLQARTPPDTKNEMSVFVPCFFSRSVWLIRECYGTWKKGKDRGGMDRTGKRGLRGGVYIQMNGVGNMYGA